MNFDGPFFFFLLQCNSIENCKMVNLFKATKYNHKDINELQHGLAKILTNVY